MFINFYITLVHIKAALDAFHFYNNGIGQFVYCRNSIWIYQRIAIGAIPQAAL